MNDQAPPLHPVVAKVKRIEAELNRYIIGMEREIHGAFLALAARQHVFLLSPPGAGKTLLASEVCRRVRGASYFKMQLDASVSKDDLFGPVSIRALRDADSLTRRTEGNLPTADIAQLDEIWKCPPMILHTLLTLLNEREYRNGEQLLAAPLVSCFVTSNETPPADRSLDALYDRILLRYQVKPLRNIEERQRASTFRVRMRAFEAEARRVAADIAHERERSFALRADEIERDALTAARAQAHIELRARQAELAVSAGGVLEAMMSQLTNDAERRSLELQAEALDAAAAEIARLRAEIDSGAIDRPGTPAYLAHPERWLIDSYGELFSSAIARSQYRDGLFTIPTPASAEQLLLVERMLAWADDQQPPLELPYANFLQRDDLDALYRLVLAVDMPDAVEESFYRILDKLGASERTSAISVRRETELRLLVAASAVLAGRPEASIDDLEVMVDALWDRPEQRDEVRRAVEDETAAREQLLAAIAETITMWETPADEPPSVALKKLAQMNHELDNFERLATLHLDRPEVVAALAAARAARDSYKAGIVGQAPDDEDDAADVAAAKFDTTPRAGADAPGAAGDPFGD